MFKNKNVKVAALSVFTVIIQFLGYGLGFLRSQYRLHILGKPFTNVFPKMFNS